MRRGSRRVGASKGREPSLAARLEALQRAFVDALVDTVARMAVGALRGEPKLRGDDDGVAGGARWKNRQRPRALIARDVERIAQLLRLEGRPLRADEIREKLGLTQRALALPLHKGVVAGRWVKQGARAMTVYRAR
jgi:hypothetical protein